MYGGHAPFGVTVTDGRERLGESGPDVAGGRVKRAPGVDRRGDPLDASAERVLAVAGGCVDGQEVACLGVQHEQQPVQQRQRGVVDLVELRHGIEVASPTASSSVAIAATRRGHDTVIDALAQPVAERDGEVA